MDTRNLVVGNRVVHARDGAGKVTYVGADYIGIVFEDGREALIRRATLEHDVAAAAAKLDVRPVELPWPASTFCPENDGAQHFLGSHWNPFVEDSNEIMKRLRDLLPNALGQTGYGEHRKPSRDVPTDWPKGFELVWPLRVQGLALILKIEADANYIVSIFPFFATGSQHTMTVREVTVWEGGLEAQITATLGEGEVSFFDTQYVINRAWYESGKTYDFILTGVAYDAAPAEKHEWTVTRHPDEVAWMNQRRQDGEALHEATVTMQLDGAAMLLPVSGWDVDDHSFHAPVKSVTPFQDWLGQSGWRVRAAVMRCGDEDVDLDIVITQRAWKGEQPPRVGQDIEGRLWLQGYLWMPK